MKPVRRLAETLNDVMSAKLYARFVAGHPWFRHHDFRLADSKSIPDIDGFLKQSLGREIFSNVRRADPLPATQLANSRGIQGKHKPPCSHRRGR
jgi:hypothetical protein